MKRVSITTALVFIAVSVFIFLKALTFPPANAGVPGPGFFPMILSGIVILLSVLLIINESKGKGDSTEVMGIFSRSNARVWVALGLTSLYVVLINVIGFVTVTPFYLFALMRYFKVKRVVVNILVSVLTTLSLYTIFTILLAVQLPSGLLM